MKLSEAIREGAKLRPQYVGGDFFGMVEAGEWGTCANGAAIEALTGVSPAEGEPREICRFYFYSFLPNWYRDTVPYHIFDSIAEDNDCNGLTREQIADKLEAMGY